MITDPPVSTGWPFLVVRPDFTSARNVLHLSSESPGAGWLPRYSPFPFLLWSLRRVQDPCFHLPVRFFVPRTGFWLLTCRRC